MAALEARPELILRDDNGHEVLHGNARVPFYDFRLAEARDLYVKGDNDNFPSPPKLCFHTQLPWIL